MFSCTNIIFYLPFFLFVKQLLLAFMSKLFAHRKNACVKNYGAYVKNNCLKNTSLLITIELEYSEYNHKRRCSK